MFVILGDWRHKSMSITLQVALDCPDCFILWGIACWAITVIRHWRKKLAVEVEWKSCRSWEMFPDKEVLCKHMTNQILNFTFAIYCVGALRVWTPTSSPSRIHKPPMAICVQTPTPLCFFHLPSNQTQAPFPLHHLSTSKTCHFPTCWRITKFLKCSIAGRRPVSRYWRLKSTSMNFMVIIRDWRKRCSSYGENFKFCKWASGEYQVLESYFSLKILHRFSPCIISETQSNSVSPSNSVSQVGSGSISNLPVQCAFSQPLIWPPHYSHKILWTLKDCQKDLHNIVLSQTNHTQPWKRQYNTKTACSSMQGSGVRSRWMQEWLQVVIYCLFPFHATHQFWWRKRLKPISLGITSSSGTTRSWSSKNKSPY